jgi:hypothetical protein
LLLDNRFPELIPKDTARSSHPNYEGFFARSGIPEVVGDDFFLLAGRGNEFRQLIPDPISKFDEQMLFTAGVPVWLTKSDGMPRPVHSGLDDILYRKILLWNVVVSMLSNLKCNPGLWC